VRLYKYGGGLPIVTRVGTKAWTDIGWIEVDSATAGFGDGSCRKVLGSPVLDLRLRHMDPDAREMDFSRHGVPLIAFSTMADGAFPVELAHDRAGRLLAARMCLTTDVDELAGSWQPVGAVPITSGTCIAADPFIARDLYQRRFECPTGLFPVEVYEWRDPEDGIVDRLGIRICFERWSAEGGWADPDGS
jgi:hypothetical protein